MTIATGRWDDHGKLVHRLRHGAEQNQRLISYSEAIPDVEPLVFFATRCWNPGFAFYMERVADQFTLVGLGAAELIRGSGPQRFQTVADAWQRLLSEYEPSVGDLARDVRGVGPNLMGGFSFDPLQTNRDPAWQPFGDALMALPHTQLTRVDGQCYLTYNVLHDSASSPQRHASPVDQQIDQALRQRATLVSLASSLRQWPQGIAPHRLVEPVPAEQWRAIVGQTTEAIGRNQFQKIVLARKVVAEYGAALEIEATLRQLREVFPTAYLFAVTLGDYCYMGATPELLIDRSGSLIRTMALAGSAPRGQNLDEDQRLGDDLIGSPKNCQEHASVVRMLARQLGPLCESIHIPERPELLKLANVQHLHTPIEARLHTPISLLKLTEQLHPTPALGGDPSAAALAFIREHEQMDRGWYAGPVGWTDAQGEGSMAVAIRSALVEHQRIHLFTGCGIVADSNPLAEYQESQWKLQGMIKNLIVPA